MANNEIRSIAGKHTPGLQSEDGTSGHSGCSDMAEPTPQEGHRLMKAFLQIRDPKRRAWLVEQAERIATLKSFMR